MAKPREVVIVAGKGHQDWQEYWDGGDLESRETEKVGAGAGAGAWLGGWVGGCRCLAGRVGGWVPVPGWVGARVAGWLGGWCPAPSSACRGCRMMRMQLPCMLPPRSSPYNTLLCAPPVLPWSKPGAHVASRPAPPPQSWFDDRVECRNALSKLSYLQGIKDLDRNFLPWTRYPEERDLLVGAGYSDAVPSDY